MNNNQPLVSVIIPCYNVQQYVIDTLNSVAEQSYPNLEIICVDDGSADDTFQTVNRWIDHHRDLRVFSIQQPNKGANAARNLGLQHAHGEYLQFLDADDILYPDKIKHQVELFRQNPEAAFVAGAYYKRAVNGEITHFGVASANMFSVFTRTAGITSSNLFKYQQVADVKGWRMDISSSQEADLMLRILLSGNGFIADNNIYTEIRERSSGQISQGKPIKRIKNFLAVRMDFMAEIKTAMPHEWEKNRRNYQSFMVSTLLIGEKYQPGFWKNYRQILPAPRDLKPIGGLGKKVILLAKYFGYPTLFKIQALRKRIGL